MGNHSKFVNNIVDNCSNLVYNSSRYIGFYHNYPEVDSFVVSGNTLINSYIYTGLCSGLFCNNNISYDFGVDRVECFKPGAKNGITIHASMFHKSLNYKIIDNTIINVPEDAILLEGFAPNNISETTSD